MRLREPYGTKAFWAEYRAALFQENAAQRRKAAPDSLSELIGDYMQSPAWQSLSDVTRATRARILKRVGFASGDMPATEIDRAMIVAGREKATGPGAAKHLVTTLRGLFKWAVDVERLAEDPTAGVAIPTPKKGKGYHTWTEAEIAAYEARWPIGTRQRLWMAVLLHTGLRRADAVRLRWADICDGVIHITAQKTGTPIVIPLEPELEAIISAMNERGREYVIEGLEGEPFTPASFSVLFWRACKEAGVKGSAHGLRKAATVRLAYAGATVPELNASMGWTGSKMATRYIEQAERARLAKAAYEKARKK